MLLRKIEQEVHVGDCSSGGGVSQRKVSTTLLKNQLYSFHVQCVQALKLEDFGIN